ncbi:guanylyl cyclase [Cystoisospora suis]|uniref:Guanylyl cyclase n=1 Tax=Cystoisospora suis TaxID=483139 RepID=A0A2C6J5G4_9APIC|nr:guanylyl cyclase [Cystoisospora suis]
MMRRDVTAVRGTYRRRFTILGNAPRVLVRRHSLKGNNVHGAGGPHGKRGQPAKGEATPAASLRYQRQHAGDQAGAFEDEDEGLRELRREIERAGGLAAESPSEMGSMGSSLEKGV